MPADERVVLAGMACRFPDADDPASLLANTLDGRQSFRRIPPERLAIADYSVELIGEADSITLVPAGLLTNWQFDPSRFRIPRAAFESADLAHWLALEVAADAIGAAGGIGCLDRETTAVVVANTLTGEFSRASSLRLRWPWLDRELSAALEASGLTAAQSVGLRSEFRERLRAALPSPDEESLAGGLSNTIAGRIANYFDLHGGAFTVDAACASSLVAISNAAGLIASSRARSAIVVAVDLSLDPFELVGFSRNGALTPNRMRVFDARAEGFWPGEGAGAVVLTAQSEARRRNIPHKLELVGWAVTTDGRGGLTRPDADGQRRAISRACDVAGIAPAEIGYVEAHGTGTAVGDPTEVRALADFIGYARRAPLPIGSIKANIGHTKAAAGMAGLIRTAQSMLDGIIPPHAGCERPHPIFAETGGRVRVATAPEPWPQGRRVAGISSFGFGGVNSHVVLSGPPNRRARRVPSAPLARIDSLFLFQASDRETMRAQLAGLAARVPTLSYSDVADAAAHASNCLGLGDLRLAFRVSSPGELMERLAAADRSLDGVAPPGILFGQVDQVPKIGLLFPGQAAPVRLDAGAWTGRFPDRFPVLQAIGDPARTNNAQPAIIRACLAAIEFIEGLGIEAEAALGHSLGELAALGWAGAIPRDALISLAAARGNAMAALEEGAMAQLACTSERAIELARGLSAVPACFNADRETVMSGTFEAIADLAKRAEAAGFACTRLNVSHAFHSPEMAQAAGPLKQSLSSFEMGGPQRAIASTVTGTWLPAEADISELLVRQLTAPVRFSEAAAALLDRADVLIEAGPGAGLSRLLASRGTPVLTLDMFSETMAPALDAVAALFVRGVSIEPAKLFEGPGIRPLPVDAPTLLASPCGVKGGSSPGLSLPQEIEGAADEQPPRPQPQDGALATLIRLIAAETGWDEQAILPTHRFLDDLHLNSLAVNRLLTRASSALGRTLPTTANSLANARLNEAAAALDESAAAAAQMPQRIAGVAPWVRCFEIIHRPLPPSPDVDLQWCRTSLETPRTDPADGLLIELQRPWNQACDAAPLLRLCQQAIGNYSHLGIVHGDAPLSGFARSIASERLFDSVRLIQGTADKHLLRRRVSGFEEIVRMADGQPAIPELAPILSDVGSSDIELGTILVTGGGRGIGAECALRLAEQHGTPLILVGRASPTDPNVSATMARARAIGVPARYVQSDVTDAAALHETVADAMSVLGPVTHLIHAAGVNLPMAFPAIDSEQLERTVAPKTAGLIAAIDACGPSLKRVVAFGSLIGRLGLAGEAHYALANAEQTRLLDRIARGRPELSALAVEWSVWSVAGMGERLGAIEQLAAGGVDALTLDEALDAFEAVTLSTSDGAVVVSSRFGANAPLAAIEPERFVERTLIHTPGVELVAETSIGIGRDPYLVDHRLHGEPLMPAVMMLEAMAQAARSLDGSDRWTCANVRFDAAIHAGQGDLGLRIAALLETDGRVRTDIRSSVDGYQRALAGAEWQHGELALQALPPDSMPEFEADALYGPLFFHGPAFRRLATLGGVSSRTVNAWFNEGSLKQWFGSFEPQRLTLGDPGLRDAALHALQCCVPHRQLVPLTAARIDLCSDKTPVRLHARECWSRDKEYAFDILLADDTGKVVEMWHEAVFRTVGDTDIAAVLTAAPALRRSWLERLAREATGDDTLSLALIDNASADRDERRAQAAAELGLAAPPLHRGDGKPVTVAGRNLSFAHSGGVTIAVASDNGVGCDVEKMAEFAAAELALAWTAEETLRKIGSRAPLAQGADGLFTGDSRERIAAFASVPTAGAGPVAVAVGTATSP